MRACVTPLLTWALQSDRLVWRRLRIVSVPRLAFVGEMDTRMPPPLLPLQQQLLLLLGLAALGMAQNPDPPGPDEPTYLRTEFQPASTVALAKRRIRT